MANIGTSDAGKTVIGAGNGVSPTFASIGTNSGLTAHGILLAQGNSPFTRVGPTPTAGQVLQSLGSSADPAFSTAVYPSTTTAFQLLASTGTNAIGGLTAGTNGQVLIGSTSAVPAFATLTSSDSSISFTTGAGTLSLQVASGTTVGKTITGDSGGALSPTAGNWTLAGSGSIATSGAGSTLTTALTGLTNHALLVGAGTATITKLGPTATAGQVLQSAGASADPAFSTATYPATATGTGTILRADGTNWVATTSTYPNTNAVSTLLYASSANVMGALATANNGLLVTSNTGVPSILAGPGTTGNILQSNAAAAPSFSTATYPATATGTGTILRADGTNWVATTSTYPNTNAVSTLLYASSANVMAALATANNGLLVTSATGVPSILAGSGATGNILQSNAAAAPSFSTATYPSVATGTGTILRANGTNWLASTSTYPDTNAINTLLYASSANVMAALATANSGVLSTSATGVPSIDTTNFAVLTTGLQLKGNNTNTAPPAGFIGEQIRSFVATGSAVTLSNNTGANITSISLTAGVWDVSGIINFNGAVTGTNFTGSITTTSASVGSGGDNAAQTPYAPTAANDQSVSIPSYRILTSTTTTVYLNAFALFSAGTCKAYGRISATRVG